MKRYLGSTVYLSEPKEHEAAEYWRYELGAELD